MISILAAWVVEVMLLPPQGADPYWFMIHRLGDPFLFKIVGIGLSLVVFYFVANAAKSRGGDPWFAVLVVLGSFAAFWRFFCFEWDDLIGLMMSTWLLTPVFSLTAPIVYFIGMFSAWEGLAIPFLAVGVYFLASFVIPRRVAIAIAVLTPLVALFFKLSAPVLENYSMPALLGVSFVAIPFVIHEIAKLDHGYQQAGAAAMYLSGLLKLKFAHLSAVVAGILLSTRPLRERYPLAIIAILFAVGVLYTVWTNPVPSQHAVNVILRACAVARDMNVPIYNSWSVGYWVRFWCGVNTKWTPGTLQNPTSLSSPSVVLLPARQVSKLQRKCVPLGSFEVEREAYLAAVCR